MATRPAIIVQHGRARDLGGHYQLRVIALGLFLLSALLIVNMPVHAQAVSQTPTLNANDWPMYQHDPAHSGRTPATVYNDGPLFIQWAYSFGERVEVEAQPIVANGVLYQGVMNGEMHAINAYNGHVLWIKRPGGPIAHTAAVDGARVYFGSLDGNVYALKINDGALAWTFTTGGPVVSAPTVVDNRLFIGSNDGNLYALNAATGEKLWQVHTGGPVVSSPAVVNGHVYFGDEDLKARCVDAATGAILWETQLYGFSMHNTHPVVSDNGQVVIFVTVKPGASSYVPLDDYPGTSTGANPVATWNAYYHAHPKYRTLYYLRASDGADLWDYNNQLYVPMPIPYWGLEYPVLHPDGSALFASPSGAAGYSYELDHDNRLIRMDLSTGVAAQIAGGSSLPEFQTRPDEVGRYAIAGTGNDIGLYLSSSEDLGVYHLTGSKVVTGLFGDRNPAVPQYIDFGSHMHPLSPLPDRHLWRYGGVIAMGGVPGTSVPIIANNMAYMTSYSWLYALGPTDHGYNPATSFPARDARLYTDPQNTYPRDQAPTLAEIHSEVAQRVADLMALGLSGSPMAVRWEQPGGPMLHNESQFEVYGYDFQVVRALSEAYPFLSSAQRVQLKNYLSTYVANTLLNSSDYEYRLDCLFYGETQVRSGEAECDAQSGLQTQWFVDNPNFIGQRLYALWIYANNTGDWASISAHWNLISHQLQIFVNAYDPSLGFCNFPLWHSGRLNIGAQIAAAEGLRNMAAHLGYTSVSNSAQTLLNNLLDGRVALANFVPNLYDTGLLQPAPLRINPDGTLNYDDINGPDSPYNHDMIAFDAALRNRETDPSQLNWWENDHSLDIDAGIGFMYYPALSGYFPLTDEMSARLRSSLLEKTQYYVKSYEINDPWWWMSDLSHSTTGSGEHLYHSPTLAWSMFQVKAHVLEENYTTLVRELPEPVNFNSKYDLYRLQNLVILMEAAQGQGPDLSTSTITASTTAPKSSEVVSYNIIINNIGGPFSDTVSLTNHVPAGLSYISGSLHASLGVVDASAAPELHWSGVLNDTTEVTISYNVSVTVPPGTIQSITNTASIFSTPVGTLTRSVTVIVNSYELWLPMTEKR